MKVGLYPRVSTLEQAREGYSIGEQIERMKNFSAAKDWNIYKVYTDAGFSGANTNRPGLQAMISDIQHHKIDMVLVYKLDRLSRSQKDTLYLIEDVFLANNVHFASLTENFDTSTPFGRAMIGILSVFAQLEREQFRERSKMGKEARAKEGLHHGGTCPIGYDYINGQLIINEYEATQIREIYRLFLEGDAISAIERKMAESGYTHKHGSWLHNENRIRYILNNPLYAGWIQNKNEISKGQHTAIISQKIFDEAAAKLNERAKGNPDRKSAFQHGSLLSGFLYCKHCGARYFKQTKKKFRPEKTYIYYKYICYSRYGLAKHMVKDPNCRNKIVNMETVDEAVITAIKSLIACPDEVEKLLQNHVETDPNEEVRKAACSRLTEISKSINKLMDLYLSGGIDISIISTRVSYLQQEQQALEDKLKSIETRKPLLSVEETKEMLNNIGDMINSDDLEVRRKFIDALITKVEIDNNDIFIYWKFF